MRSGLYLLTRHNSPYILIFCGLPTEKQEQHIGCEENICCLDYDSPGTIDNKCNKSDYSIDVGIDIDLQILITQDL